METAGEISLAGDGPAVNQPDRATSIRAVTHVILGAAITLSLTGYQFGESNHAVYLLAALRVDDPTLLANDWWVNSTLQYHVLFTHLCAVLMRWHVIESTFLIGYITLAVLLHVAWLRIARALGASDGAYLFSVVLYYLLAGGLGLGVYRFLQDSCFLPSNISNVALLWAIYFYMAGRLGAAGLCVGVAGAFHLNYALVGLAAVAALGGWAVLRGGVRPLARSDGWLAALLALALSCIAIVPAVGPILRRSGGGVPLGEFVDLYVRLRHPHHYDPASWPIALWLSFVAPLPVFYFLYRRHRGSVGATQAGRVFVLCLGLLIIAEIGAGIWFVSPALVQMSLWRFSIYPKLLSCIALAWIVWRAGLPTRGVIVIAMIICLFLWIGLLSQRNAPVMLGGLVARNVWPVGVFLGLATLSTFAAWRVEMRAIDATTGDDRERTPCILLKVPLPRGSIEFQMRPWAAGQLAICALFALTIIVWQWRDLGLRLPGLEGDDTAYQSAANWARHHTPRDAIFLVPPDEESFRLRGERAIVVNFKNVPQLSAELPAWRDRLRDVLGMDDLRALDRPMARTLADLRQRYTSQSGTHLVAVARKYDARYLLATRKLDDEIRMSPVWRDSRGGYFLYDLAGLLAQRSQPTP